MALFEGELGALCDGVLVELPVFFLLYGPDDDALRHGQAFLPLADVLQPCRVCSLDLDEVDLALPSMAELAEVCAQRVAGYLNSAGPDGEEFCQSRVVLVGFGMLAIVAHRTAAVLSDAGRDVALVLMDSEVSWPPSQSLDRMGGYAWLGGEVEAALLACRTLGLHCDARAEVEDLQEFPDNLLSHSEREELLMRIYWKLASSGMPQAYFEKYIADTGVLLDGLNYLAGTESRPRVFAGVALLLLACGSPEFQGAQASAEALCPRLQVAKVAGSHYQFCQPDKAGVPIHLAQTISEFLLRSGFYGQDASEALRSATSAIGESATDAAKPLARAYRFEFLD